jgi:hypothetical protein
LKETKKKKLTQTKSKTPINLAKLGNLVEEIHKEILTHLKENRLKVCDIEKLVKLNTIYYLPPL